MAGAGGLVAVEGVGEGDAHIPPVEVVRHLVICHLHLPVQDTEDFNVLVEMLGKGD